jgi:hypothetical protein
VANPGGVTTSKLTIQPGTWIHQSDVLVQGKPAKARLTLTDVSPAGGSWKNEMSIAGGPWTVVAEGKYTAAT